MIELVTSFTWLYALVNLAGLWATIQPIVECVLWYFANIYTYHITSVEQVNIIMNHVKLDWSWYRDEDQRPYGIIIDRQFPPTYIVYRAPYDRDELMVYTSHQYYKDKLSQPIQHGLVNLDLTTQPKHMALHKDIKNQRSIRMICRKGSQAWAGYREMTITSYPKYSFTPKQSTMFKQVMTHYNQHGFAKVLISGPMHTGKTSFGYLLARELETSLCVSFNPTEPSDNLSNLCTTVDHGPTQPLIILLDEVDHILRSITHGIPRHKKYLISVRNKQQWNNMMDQIEWGIYQHVILIMTTNKPVKYLQQYDPSYIRPGRMNMIFEMTTLNELPLGR